MTCQYTSRRTPSSSTPRFRSTTQKERTQPEKMEPAAAAGESLDPPLSPPPEASSPEETPSSSSTASGTQAPAPAPAPSGTREVAAAMEAVERDAAAIAESYASLFASLRVALSNVRTLSSCSKTAASLRALFSAALLCTATLH